MSVRHTAISQTAASRGLARVVALPPPSPGFIGDGHTAVQAIGPQDFARNDPFIMLADDRLDLPRGQRAGAAHPHAGFEIATLIVDGEMRDRDEGLLRAGDVVWTTAGSGIVHSDRAKKFYNQLFGWQVQDWSLSDGSVYVGARTVAVDETRFVPKEPGAINGGIVKRDSIVKTPQVTVNVPSIDEYLEKVKAAGGGVLKGRTKIEDTGYYAYVSDTEGNLLGLWEDIKR